ncbi:DUF2059 domain-containing protein [Roseibium aggregatum]|uniref:DUF2059 domain-containing protein n=1 Tax=Roseibium aggregatum TaxID=187304 RepID=A0A939EB56_9HYPH|nr:DUF2059 domain-containing protein [Roseibium aggregatum]MBN9669935.1 DUF2059 domain-containing protein [Roseibium aggregatum]
MKRVNKFTRAAALGTALFATGIFSAGAIAQETGAAAQAPAKPSFSESHLAAAKKVAITTKSLEPFDEILPLMVDQSRTAFIQATPARAEEIVEVTQEVALKLAPKRAELNDVVYQAWAQLFTEEELNQLADFYSTDLGQKLTENIPKISAFSVRASREWQDKISTEMVTMIQEELKRRNEAAQ